jgi:ATP phosphoribosyltransferase
MNKPADKLILAVPKGRILKELLPLFESCGIVPEEAFADENSRLLQFKTNRPDLDLIRVRAFDVPTFVAFGGAQLGVAGSDVLDEFDYTELYAPVNLGIGQCRLSVAMPEGEASAAGNAFKPGHVRVATKYPHLTQKYYESRGVQAECIKLNGAMEIVPKLGMARRIVDLVSTGSTLRANGMVEMETICTVSSRLIVNRTALKTRPEEMGAWIESFRSAADSPSP